MRIVAAVAEGAAADALRRAQAAGLRAWRGNRPCEVVVEGWRDRVLGWAEAESLGEDGIRVVFD